MTFSKWNFPSIVHFGAGVRQMLGAVLREAAVTRPFFVTDSGVAGLPFFSDLREQLDADGFSTSTYAHPSGNPVLRDVTSGVDAYWAAGADGVIIVGGGAPLDVGKAIALMIHHPGTLWDYEDGNPDSLPVDQPIPFVVAIPTTAGTGSEVGRSSVISEDDTHVKRIIFDPRMLPPVILADPELTLGLPASITAATGMDALTHNVEAYLSRGYHPMADGIALQGVHLCANALVTAVREPGNIGARADMLAASLMGATAFQKGLGVTHSLAHPLSTVCDTHHGLANAVMIPYAMEFNARHVPGRFVRLAQVCGAGDDAAAFLRWLREIRAALDIPDKLGALGVTEDHLDRLVSFAVSDPCHQCNPVDVSEADIRAMYEAAL
jgi:alcohol dehydrogenase class IV